MTGSFVFVSGLSVCRGSSYLVACRRPLSVLSGSRSVNSSVVNRIPLRIRSTSWHYYSKGSQSLLQQHQDKKSNDEDNRSQKIHDIPQEPVKDTTNAPQQSPGLFQRFKDAYKEYGKVLIGVHAVTSCMWYGGFYYMAKS